jgi:hypothetical protein
MSLEQDCYQRSPAQTGRSRSGSTRPAARPALARLLQQPAPGSSGSWAETPASVPGAAAVPLPTVAAPRRFAGSGGRNVPVALRSGLVTYATGALLFAFQSAALSRSASHSASTHPAVCRDGNADLALGNRLGWSDQHTLALTSGALLTYMLYSFHLSARGHFAAMIVHRVGRDVIALLCARLLSRQAHRLSMAWEG